MNSCCHAFPLHCPINTIARALSPEPGRTSEGVRRPTVALLSLPIHYYLFTIITFRLSFPFTAHTCRREAGGLPWPHLFISYLFISLPIHAGVKQAGYHGPMRMARTLPEEVCAFLF